MTLWIKQVVVWLLEGIWPTIIVAQLLMLVKNMIKYSQDILNSHFTNTRNDIARIQEQSVQNEQHNKTLNPKISALLDTIHNEED